MKHFVWCDLKQITEVVADEIMPLGCSLGGNKNEFCVIACSQAKNVGCAVVSTSYSDFD